DSPTSRAPMSPGPCVAATRRTSASAAPELASACSTTGPISSRWRRDATSGTTPPKRAWRSSWELRIEDSTRPPSSSTAAQVSSHDVSSARITRGGERGAASLGAGRVLPHDQGVLAVVRVVAAPYPGGLKAETLVQPDRSCVRDAHLERVA